MVKKTQQKGQTVKLGSLIDDEASKPVASSDVSDVTDSELLKSETTEVSKSETIEVPKYLTFARKDTRLHEDQLDELVILVRQLNRKRKGGERLTENTLIRIAIDLLLARASELEGNTEDELRNSVSLELRKL